MDSQNSRLPRQIFGAHLVCGMLRTASATGAKQFDPAAPTTPAHAQALELKQLYSHTHTEHLIKCRLTHRCEPTSLKTRKNGKNSESRQTAATPSQPFRAIARYVYAFYNCVRFAYSTLAATRSRDGASWLCYFSLLPLACVTRSLYVSSLSFDLSLFCSVFSGSFTIPYNAFA